MKIGPGLYDVSFIRPETNMSMVELWFFATAAKPVW